MAKKCWNGKWQERAGTPGFHFKEQSNNFNSTDEEISYFNEQLANNILKIKIKLKSVNPIPQGTHTHTHTKTQTYT